MNIFDKQQPIYNSNNYLPVMPNNVKKKYMTALELGSLLGLKKTERYYLINKKYFKIRQFYNGKMLVDIESFEDWYSRQLHYKKINGEEPGLQLKEWLLTPGDIARLFGISQCTVYDILSRYNIKTVVIDNHKMVPKKDFWEWYNSQTHYRTVEDREKDRELEESTISMPEMARLLGVKRSKVYYLLTSKKYKDYFEIVYIAEQKRVTKNSFNRFLTEQDKYHLAIKAIDETSHKKETQRKLSSNSNYLTLIEAAEIAGVSRARISECYASGVFPVVTIGRNVFIKRDEFENWLQTRNTKR